MDVSPNTLGEQNPQASPSETAQSSVQAKSAYGTLGPNSDVTLGGTNSAEPSRQAQAPAITHTASAIALVIGVLLAVFALNVSKAHASWDELTSLFSGQGTSAPSPAAIRSASDFGQLDRLPPQQQAENLLELAVANSDGAVEQIAARAERWRGSIAWNSQIANLTSAALNGKDMRVRESGVEVELAAYGLARNSETVDSLVADALSSDHAQKVWALWALGLMANRGVETERVVEALRAHLQDADEDSRRWSVEGLALAGTTPTIATLLKTMHDDPSPVVRERAACSLAESGMLTHEQRLMAVPQLVNYSDDATLDAQTHAWARQALADITHQRLPNNSTAWREWYVATQGR
jgi:HEAT repeats